MAPPPSAAPSAPLAAPPGINLPPEKLRPAVAGSPTGPEPPFPIRLSGPIIKGFGRGSKEVKILIMPFILHFVFLFFDLSSHSSSSLCKIYILNGLYHFLGLTNQNF